MSSQESRPAIDLAPASPPRPNLALILALLAIPGSTLAWELPLGGLWIGLPLAIAAIVLGLRSRREGVAVGRSTAAVVVAGLCIAQMVVWTAVSVSDAAEESAATGTLTFKQVEESATLTHIHNTTERLPKANLAGDVIVFGGPLTDLSGKRVGKLHAACVTTSGARNYLKSKALCTGAIALRDGTLTMQFLENPASDTTTGAITGGTGAYANARGVVVSEATKGGETDTITFAD